MKKVITTCQLTLRKLNAGCGKLMRAIAPTYGAGGKTVLNAGYTGAPELLGKGASAAAAISLADVTENAGAILLRAAGEKTADLTGDGSITAMLIAEAIIREGARAVTAGCSPVFIRRGIELARKAAEDALREMTLSPCDEYTGLAAALTAGDEELGALVCQALQQAGYDGVVTVKPSDTDRSYVSEDIAYSIPAGYQSKYMADSETSGEAVLENAAVFVCASPIMSIHDILPLLNEASIQKQTLLILSESIAPEVVKSFVSNIAQGVIRLCSVEAPGVGAVKRAALEDAAALTGAVVFGTPLNPDTKAALLSTCGRAAKVRVTQSKTLIYGASAAETPGLKEYTGHLASLLRLEHNELEDERLRQRIARLTGRTAELRIGAASDAERRLLTSRAECALKAARAAANGGVLPGGGTAYIRALPCVRKLCAGLSGDEKAGAGILAAALEAPLRTLSQNAWYAPSEVTARVAEGHGNYGFDIASGQYADMLSRGVIDPAAVVITALRSAVSVGAQLLTADAAVLIDGAPIYSIPVPDDLHITPQDFM